MFNNPGGAQTIFAGGGRHYAFNNLGVAPMQVIGDNPQRMALIFHNPGATDIFVAPLKIQNGGSDSDFVPGPALLGGCLKVFANGGTVIIRGTRCGKAWQAFAANGNNGSLTVQTSETPV